MAKDMGRGFEAVLEALRPSSAILVGYVRLALAKAGIPKKVLENLSQAGHVALPSAKNIQKPLPESSHFKHVILLKCLYIPITEGLAIWMIVSYNHSI